MRRWTKDYITMLALPMKLLKKQWAKSTVVWQWGCRKPQFSRENPRDYLHKPYIARNEWESLGYIFAADSMGLPLFRFSSWAPKCMYFEKECVMAVQGHPRTLILDQSKARTCNIFMEIAPEKGKIPTFLWWIPRTHLVTSTLPISAKLGRNRATWIMSTWILS